MPAGVPAVSLDHKSAGTSLGMAKVYSPKDAETQIPERHLVITDHPQDGYGDSRCMGYSTGHVYGSPDLFTVLGNCLVQRKAISIHLKAHR